MLKKGFLFLFSLTVLGILVFSIAAPPLDQIPIDFFPNRMEPSVKVKAEGNVFKCLLDLGCGPELILKESAIHKLKEIKETGKTSISDAKGNIYSSKILKIQDLQIGNILFSEFEILEDHTNFHFNSQVDSGLSDTLKKELAEARIHRLDGRIGWRAIKSFDCVIDFPNSVLTLLKPGSAKKRCASAKFISAPIITDKLGISILIETDSGTYRFLLDTGSTFSFLRNSLKNALKIQEVEKGTGDWYFHTKNLSINGYNFGPWEFGFFEICDDFKIDGFLGADFFLEHAVYLDFQNNLAYFQKPEKFFLMTQWKRLKHRITQFYREKIGG